MSTPMATESWPTQPRYSSEVAYITDATGACGGGGMYLELLPQFLERMGID
jgi:hypothetical protein